MTDWLVLAAAKRKRTGGGYDDAPRSYYSWDSTVPNHGRLKVGERIAVWDGNALVGASVIEAIEVGSGEKDTPYCPACGKADVAERTQVTPRYTCWKCPATFDEPGWTHKNVTTYRSRHEAGWVDLGGRLLAPHLRELCEKPKSQLSLRALRWDDFEAALGRSVTAAPLTNLERTLQTIVGGHREVVVRARIGQPEFRRRLLDVYGQVCAFSGPAPAEALEAAHLYSYAVEKVHHSNAGLLLRRDLHRLFDVGLIAVRPTTLVLDVAPTLTEFTAYRDLHGKPLEVTVGDAQKTWLAKHWDQHRTDTAAAE